MSDERPWYDGPEDAHGPQGVAAADGGPDGQRRAEKHAAAAGLATAEQTRAEQMQDAAERRAADAAESKPDDPDKARSQPPVERKQRPTASTAGDEK